MNKTKKTPEEMLSELEPLKQALMIRVGSGFTATSYSMLEFENIFCVKREKSDRRVWKVEVLHLAVLELVAEKMLFDFDGWFGRPRAKPGEEEGIPVLVCA